jgi:methionyl-tRNA synthetase
LLEPLELGKRRCRLCGSAVQEQPVEQLVLRLSACQDFLADYFARAGGIFRPNARQETSRYLQSGLHDRAATRSLDWGVDVPLAGYGDRRVYVWIDAVLGYLSASQRWAEARGQDWRPFWSADAQAWYVHGKDNIPFHSLILPALLHGYDPSLKLPDRILSSEYLTLEGRKISTSQNWAVWLDDLLARYPADAIRYYLISNNPEKRDGDFSQRAFVLAYNGELLGAFGNLVQRTLQFICRFYEGCTPNEPCDPAIRADLAAAFADCGRLLSQGEIKAALARAFGSVRRLNQFFDQERPWQTRHDDPTRCDRTLATCLHGLLNLSSLLDPFLPFSCARIRHSLGWTEAPVWRLQAYPGGRILAPPQLLYPRLDETAELAWALTGSRDAQSVR